MEKPHKVTSETKKNEICKTLHCDPKTGTLRAYGIRCAIIDPVSCCEKADEMLGTGGEVVIHHMWFGQGHQIFSELLKNNPNKTKGEVLQGLASAYPCLGWGILSFNIANRNPQTVSVTVKNPPFKTIKGSAKRLISSFWAGVFSKYFDTKMVAKKFQYDEKKDEFRFVLSKS
jgi:hypothetical protein